jgi:hypothetical protein
MFSYSVLLRCDLNTQPAIGKSLNMRLDNPVSLGRQLHPACADGTSAHEVPKNSRFAQWHVSQMR